MRVIFRLNYTFEQVWRAEQSRKTGMDLKDTRATCPFWKESSSRARTQRHVCALPLERCPAESAFYCRLHEIVFITQLS